MKVKCINDSCGDFWDITIGKEYEIIKHVPDYLLYIAFGKNVTEERYKIKDDIGDIYSYPATCFKIVT